jgi:4'-phosphopantetheinyl transferase
VVAVAHGLEVGVDLERVRPLADAAAIAERFFAPRETAALLALPEAERERAFFACWTRKEAFIKATGEGLSRPLDEFEVAFRPGEPARVTRVGDDPGEAALWSLLGFEPAPGFLGALAARGPIGALEVVTQSFDRARSGEVPTSGRAAFLEAR